MANRLKQEKSPYLMQHGENPVDWYPWCEEAFEKARSAKDGLTDEIICRYSEEKNYEQLRKIYETCCDYH